MDMGKTEQLLIAGLTHSGISAESFIMSYLTLKLAGEEAMKEMVDVLLMNAAENKDWTEEQVIKKVEQILEKYP